MNSQKKSLIIRFSSLGDIVLCSAFVKKWRELNPESPIFFATLNKFSEILGHFSTSLEFIKLEKNGLVYFFKSGRATAKKIGPCELEVFDLQGNLKSRFFVWGLRFESLLDKAPTLIKVLKSPRKTFHRICSVLFRKDFIGPRKIFIEHQKLITDTDFLHPELRASPKISALPRSGYLLAPDSQHWKKKIPPNICENILLEILQNTFENITLVGSPGSLDELILARIQTNFPNRIINLLGQTALDDLPTLARQHRLCICGNSAWLHIAEAVGTPVLSFAGPIVEGFGFSPWRLESRELAVELKCRPCTRHGGGSCSQKGENFHACVKKADWKTHLKDFMESHQ